MRNSRRTFFSKMTQLFVASSATYVVGYAFGDRMTAGAKTWSYDSGWYHYGPAPFAFPQTAPACPPGMQQAPDPYPSGTCSPAGTCAYLEPGASCGAGCDWDESLWKCQ